MSNVCASRLALAEALHPTFRRRLQVLQLTVADTGAAAATAVGAVVHPLSESL